MRFLESEWSPKMDASNESEREHSWRTYRWVNPLLDREFSPQPSLPYKNPTNPTNRA
jgi:hypothetical protein